MQVDSLIFFPGYNPVLLRFLAFAFTHWHLMIQIWPDDLGSLALGDASTKVAFISDLHLQSGRCNADDHLAEITAAIEDCDLCVWGGDLFDFRWTRVSDDAKAVQTAIDWLGTYCAQHPETSFVYLNGNHDAHAPFAARLLKWSQDISNLTAGVEALRVGETLFLHGDVIEGDGSDAAFQRYRQRWSHQPRAGTARSRLYDLAVAARAHRVVSALAHQNTATCRKLVRWIERQPTSETAGLTRVVFGHTHRQLRHFYCGSFEFHNGGAAIRHCEFAPILLTCQI